MNTGGIQRDIGKNGSVDLKDARCTFTLRGSPGVLEILIEGVDKGQLGSAPLDEIARALVRDRPVELTVSIAQHLSQTGQLIQIYSGGEICEARKSQAMKR